MNNNPTIVAADGHMHIYPAYDLKAVFRNLIHNLSRLAQDAGTANPPADEGKILKIGFMAESSAFDYFRRLKERDKALAVDGLTVGDLPDPTCLTVTLRGVGQAWIVSGRQIATRERLEILGLAMRAQIPDGLPAAEVIQRVAAAGGIPVLPWAPGKWLFARGRLAQELLADRGRCLLLGDSRLRPAFWPEPRLMRQARAHKIAVLPGSDPLPLAGEERFAGTYGFVYQGAFDVSQPVAAIGAMLAGPGRLTPAGVRSRIWTVARRLYQLRMAGR